MKEEQNNSSFISIQCKTKFIEYYEESKENINLKMNIIFSLIQSIKEENDNLFSKSKS